MTERRARLVVENLSKSFGGVSALAGVSLTAYSRQVLSIIGPNGAGKTTLINLLCGVYPKDTGRVLLDEDDISALPAHDVARQGLARTFQNVALFRGLSVLDNLYLGRNAFMRCGAIARGLYAGSARREERAQREIVEWMIDYLDLSLHRRSMVGVLPLGLQKRVELGRALLADPRVLLLDEPMGGMNVEEKEAMVRFILDVAALRDTALVLVEHDMGIVMDISDRVLVLNEGAKLTEGSPEAVRSDRRVIAAYLGQERAA